MRVSLVDPHNQSISALWPAWQCLFQHLDDIARGQQFQARLMSRTLLGDEQHCEHDHRHMVVPGPPPQHLIVRQAALAFGIFEGALDPIAMSLHPAETSGSSPPPQTSRPELPR